MRSSRTADEPLLYQLFAENKAAEFAALGAEEQQLQPLLQMQYRARCVGYGQVFPSATQHIVLNAEGDSVGHVLLHEDEAAVRIVDLAVVMNQRGSGVGTAVVKAVQHMADAATKSVRLRVAQGSRAQRLYHRLGFVTTAQDAVSYEMEWSAEQGPRMNES